MANAGKVLMSAKRYSEAEPLFREAWERHKAARGEATSTLSGLAMQEEEEHRRW